MLRTCFLNEASMSRLENSAIGGKALSGSYIGSLKVERQFGGILSASVCVSVYWITCKEYTRTKVK